MNAKNEIIVENRGEKIMNDLEEKIQVNEQELEDQKLAALKAKLAQKNGENKMPPRIVEKKKHSIDFFVVGSGHAGSRLAECMGKLGYTSVAINTAHQDLQDIDLPQENKLLISTGVGGAAKSRDIGNAACESYRNEIYELITSKGNNSQMNILALSLGGGSGSGSLSFLIDMLNETNKPLIVITILPMTSEDPQTKQNSLEALAALTEYMKAGKVQNTILIDNSKLETLLSNVSPVNFYKIANEQILQPLDAFNTFSAQSSSVKAIDGMEFSRLLIDGHGFSTYSTFICENWEEDTALAESVINNLDNNLLASDMNIKQSKYVGVIFAANNNVWNKIAHASCDYAMSIIQDQCGIPNAVYRGIYVAEDIKDDVVRVYSFFAGMGLPDARVSSLKQEVAAKNEALKAKDDNRNMTLNLDSGVEKTVSQAQKIKDKIAAKSSSFGKFSAGLVDKRK